MKKTIIIKTVIIVALCNYNAIMATKNINSSLNKRLEADVFVTAKDTTLRLTHTSSLLFKKAEEYTQTEISIFIDPTRTFQTILGFGGALTDASAETFAKLSVSMQNEFLQAYYSRENGIGYTLARTNMASCDFSSDIYNYVLDNDSLLSTFNLAHDEKYRIPFIKRAISAAGGKLTIYVSPWSPPAWMKDNNNVLRGGKVLPQFKQAWANYFVKFIKAYQAQEIPIWGLTVQNEPASEQRWESCIYTADDERNFIKYYLGPTMKRNKLSDKKIIVWDHNRDLIYDRAETILNDPGAAKYVWGVGYHWYETWTGGSMNFENLKLLKSAFPEKNLLFTEGCVERFDYNKMNEWSHGERYGFSMVNDFNSGAVGWTDWNVLLDEKGGPNHVQNYCFAPIHANTKTDELIYTNSYYYLGQFSKFIIPGAKRIISSSTRDKLLTTAFINPNGKVIVIILNLTEEKLPYKLYLKGQSISVESLAHSITTIVI